MIYNFNLGIGWASSGVEYAQIYRAKMLRAIGAKAKFIYTDMFPRDNIQHMTENIGFLDSEVEWLYTFFTDTKISPVTYTLKQLEASFGKKRKFTFSRNGKTAKYNFAEENCFYTVYMVDETSDRVHRVELVSRGFLIRKDYFTYCRIYSEYYAPLDNKAHMYQRRFFNEDGSIAYEEINDNDEVMYQFPDKLLCSKEEFVGYMVSRLNLTKDDVVIIDRTTGIGQAILQNAGPAKVGIVIHADHFSEGSTDENNILWNNYYEYAFSQHEKIDFYLTSTDAQNQLMRKQFEKYMGVTPNVITIPVGGLQEIKYPYKRRPYSLITASRLAAEKHVDWLVEAVAEAKKKIPDISLDIYGKGAEEQKIKELIERLGLSRCVKLCGQQDLTEVYQKYEAYVAGSTSEGFGLTLMEAIGAGLPIIGFDVRYGNQNFVDHGKNGYKIPVHDKMESKERVAKLAECIVRLFTEADRNAFHEHSYKKAKEYLTTEVEKRWETLLKTI